MPDIYDYSFKVVELREANEQLAEYKNIIDGLQVDKAGLQGEMCALKEAIKKGGNYIDDASLMQSYKEIIAFLKRENDSLTKQLQRAKIIPFQRSDEYRNNFKKALDKLNEVNKIMKSLLDE